MIKPIDEDHWGKENLDHDWSTKNPRRLECYAIGVSIYMAFVCETIGCLDNSGRGAVVLGPNAKKDG